MDKMTLQTISESLQTIAKHCSTQRQATGCYNCVFCRFCETVADGEEIIPLTTIIETMIYPDLFEAIATERRETK